MKNDTKQAHLEPTPMTKIREWEKKFDEEILELIINDERLAYIQVKDFIRSVIKEELSSLVGEIVKEYYYAGDDKAIGGECGYYNKALDKVLEIIRQYKQI